MELPTHSQVVICGGGIAGASVAYHLTKLGIDDVVLLERHQLTSGTTWHAAGLIMQLRSSHELTELAKYNVELYSQLEKETGAATGFKQNGTLGICRTKDRLLETKRTASVAKSFGIEANIISAKEAKDIYPLLDTSQVQGAIFIPNDGQTNPVDTTLSLIAGARQRGLKFFEQCEVKNLKRQLSGEFLVITNRGSIRCETLVLACGLWTREIAGQLGIHLPLYPCEHYYVLTEPMGAATSNLPVLRDTDGHSYIKEDAGRLLVGAFEPRGKPIDFSQLPADHPFIELPENWEQFEGPYLKAMEVIPDLREIGIKRFFSGPESFTPDLLFMLGEVPSVPNCFVSAGYNSEGIELNPAAGKALAEWIDCGKPTIDLGSVDINRFHRFQNNTQYLRSRASEVLGLHYKMHWPHQQKESARGVRKGVLHDRWLELNASFGQALGWERPMWFADQDANVENEYSYTQPNWFKFTEKECLAARQSVVVFDQSSLGKLLVEGRDACLFLQKLCASNVDIPCGKIVYTHMLNDRGGIEVDATVNRLAENRFLVVTSATSLPRDQCWIQRHIDPKLHVNVSDLTASYTVLSIQGPDARSLLSKLTNANLSDKHFPFACSKKIEVGYGFAICNRLTFIGELGWELFIENEFAQGVFDLLVELQSDVMWRPAGYHALEHLRCESGYREFDLELTPMDSPFDAGLGFTVDLSKTVNFNGREAIEKLCSQGHLPKRLIQFKLLNSKIVLWGEEIIWLNGRIVGHLTSGAFSFSLGVSVGMGYVTIQDGVLKEEIATGNWEIEAACERYLAKASLQPCLARKVR